VEISPIIFFKSYALTIGAIAAAGNFGVMQHFL
jgi:hypothetical protein